jgi:cephalosporin hydroxylase
MKILIDENAALLRVDAHGQQRSLPLYSREAFEILSRQWLRVGWNQKYTYTFTWLGRPIIQLPEDLVRVQEVIHRVQPSLIVETGVAHGGSLLFHATLLHAMGGGRVVGVEVDLRPHNRAAITAHPLARYVTIVDGSSIDPDVVARVRALVGEGDRTLVVLDSNHSKAHVRAELEAYHALVTPGSYIVATDGIMEDVAMAPRGDGAWLADNPAAAAREFAADHPEFVLEQPPWSFNESELRENVTHWPAAYLRRQS